MRITIVLCTLILGHCINPKILTLHIKDMAPEMSLSLILVGLLAIIFDTLGELK